MLVYHFNVKEDSVLVYHFTVKEDSVLVYHFNVKEDSVLVYTVEKEEHVKLSFALFDVTVCIRPIDILIKPSFETKGELNLANITKLTSQTLGKLEYKLLFFISFIYNKHDTSI